MLGVCGAPLRRLAARPPAVGTRVHIGITQAQRCAHCGRGDVEFVTFAPPDNDNQDFVAESNPVRIDCNAADMPRAVACVGVGRTYKHVPITRCNVDFGIDPHVEGYCVPLKDGKLATNHEDSSIPCRHRDAGWDRTTITTS